MFLLLLAFCLSVPLINYCAAAPKEPMAGIPLLYAIKEKTHEDIEYRKKHVPCSPNLRTPDTYTFNPYDPCNPKVYLTPECVLTPRHAINAALSMKLNDFVNTFLYLGRTEFYVSPHKDGKEEDTRTILKNIWESTHRKVKEANLPYFSTNNAQPNFISGVRHDYNIEQATACVMPLAIFMQTFYGIVPDKIDPKHLKGRAEYLASTWYTVNKNAMEKGLPCYADFIRQYNQRSSFYPYY